MYWMCADKYAWLAINLFDISMQKSSPATRINDSAERAQSLGAGADRDGEILLKGTGSEFSVNGAAWDGV